MSERTPRELARKLRELAYEDGRMSPEERAVLEEAAVLLEGGKRDPGLIVYLGGTEARVLLEACRYDSFEPGSEGETLAIRELSRMGLVAHAGGTRVEPTEFGRSVRVRAKPAAGMVRP